MSRNRRSFPRLDTYLLAWVRPYGKRRFQRCQVVEISEAGVQLLVESNQRMEGLLEVHIDVRPDWQVACMAYVLRQRPMFFASRNLLAATLRASKSEERSLFRLWVRQQMKATLDPEAVPTPLSHWGNLMQKLRRASGWPRCRPAPA